MNSFFSIGIGGQVDVAFTTTQKNKVITNHKNPEFHEECFHNYSCYTLTEEKEEEKTKAVCGILFGDINVGRVRDGLSVGLRYLYKFGSVSYSQVQVYLVGRF